MKKYTYLFAVFGLAVGLVSLLFLSKLIQSNKTTDIRLKAAPALSLSFDPGSGNYYPGQTFTVNIKVDSGANQLTGADLAVDFTPSVLEITGISIGDFLSGTSEILKSTDQANGQALLSYYTLNVNAKKGVGTLATITFKVKTLGTALVTFGPKTDLASVEEDQGVVTKTNASYSVVEDKVGPQAISNLGSDNVDDQSLRLTWNAPSDQGAIGKASTYELRRSSSAITEDNWSSATVVTGLSAPQSPGTYETFTVTSLTQGARYYFALKSKDEKGNSSPLSNVLTVDTPGKSTLSYKLKLEGIGSQKSAKVMKFILKQGGVTKYTLESTATSDALGVYSGSITEVDPGTYDVFVKGPVHLQKKFTSVTLNSGVVTKDWTSTPILVGDINVDGKVSIGDIRKLVLDYFPNTPASGSIADLNMDGTVNMGDVRFVIVNYFKEDETN